MNGLKKTSVIFLMGVVALFSLSSAGRAAGLKFEFKFAAGVNYQLLGDGDAILRAKQAAADYLVNAGGGTLEQGITPLFAHFGYDFDVDAILFLSPNFGISVGTGYIRGGTLFGSGNEILKTSAGTMTDSNDVAASAVPIKIGIYYKFAGRSYLFGGVGYYSSNFSHSENYTYGDVTTSYSETSKGHGIGFYAGLGGESPIGPGFSLIYEISARYASVGGFTGNWNYSINGVASSGSGKLYYYELLDYTDHWYPWTSVQPAAPAGTEFRNAREATIDFSGVTFKIGFKFSI
jgi:hypothetical protein